MNRQRILQTACLVVATLLAAACTQEEPVGGIALPEGKYPMTFATAVEGLTVTRANTAEGQWTTSDEIAVKVGNEVKKYKPTSAGTSVTLQAASGVTPFYWQKPDEKKNVSAWCCGTGTYNATLPTTWTVQTDQSTGNGYQQSDFIYAEPQELTYSNGASSQLTFKHLPAKVVINLKCGNGLTEENIQSATVRILNQAITSGTIDATTGIMTQTTATGSTAITPNVLAAPKSGFQKSVQAIVVPQKVVKGTQFIKVTIGAGTAAARDYYYTTKSAEEANIECGKQYTYDITVTKGEELEVTNQTTVTWQDGTASSEPVSPATLFYVICPRDGVDGFIIDNATLQSGDTYTVNANQTITISYAATSSLYCRLEQGIAQVTSTTANGTITLTVFDIRGDLKFSTYEANP